MKRIGFVLIPLIIFVGILALRLTFPELAEGARYKLFDLYQKLSPRQWQDAPVRVIDLDNETLTRMGQWPWPRTQVAELISKLQDSGAAVIALDIVFAEPDRTSPHNIVPLWQRMNSVEGLDKLLERLPDHDRLLAETVARGNVVLGFGLSFEPEGQTPRIKKGIPYGGDDPRIFLKKYPGAVSNLSDLDEAAAGAGGFDYFPEGDGILRRVPLILNIKNELYPSLIAETLRVYDGARSIQVKSSGASGEYSFGEKTGIASVKIGRNIIPTDKQGRIWLYDSGYVSKRFVPAWYVMSEDFDPGEVKDKIVIIGTSATGLKDIRTTPLNPAAAGVEVHVQLIEQVLMKQFLHRPDWAIGAEIMYFVVLGLLMIILMPFAGSVWCAVLAFSAIGATFALSWVAYSQMQWLIDPMIPSLAVLILYMISSWLHFIKTDQERKGIRTAFGLYMSPVLVERLAENPEQLKLGGEKRVLTIMFTDIRNFTSFSERLDAQELTKFLNRYLTPMSNIVLKYNGTIDKYMGDSIMAFWNAPLDDADHARNACIAGLEMRDFLDRWNQDLKAECKVKGKQYFPIRSGFGINTGDCSVGNMGSELRFDYSAMGDNVNLASRIEGQTKFYGVDIIIGHDTAEQVKDFATLELDAIRVKGRNQAQRIFVLLGNERLRNDDRFRHHARVHEKMLAAYRTRNWDSAADFLRECQARVILQTELEALYRIYERRIADLMANPPGADWDGTYTSLTK